MSRNIEAIFLDTGNTMRVVIKDAAFQNHARLQLAKLVGTQESPDSFCKKLSERYEASKKKSKETQFQAPEKELWTRWMLPEFPAKQIEPLAGRLTRLWIDQTGRRVPRSDVKSTIMELNTRGYKLGIIANSISNTEIPDWLQADGLEKYFSAIALSSQLGNRKPDPEIYLKAAQMMGIEYAQCAYVGDNPTRDILGTREARYGMVVIILEAATLQKEPPKEKFKPDGIIGEFAELLNIFPAAQIKKVDDMTQNIEAVFVDLGNTLRILLKDEGHMSRARQRMVELVGTDNSPDAFYEKINLRYKSYRKWAFENLSEAPESELWTRWLTPDFPAEKIAPLGAELTYQYRQSMGRRVVVDGGREVLEELQKRGYILGIISNLIGTREIPEWLKAEDYERYFKSVVLSSIFGKRKPDPSVYFEAANRAGIVPSKCAYVGDNLKRDVTGTHAAGFGQIVIMISPEELAEAEITDENRPDVIIHQFRQLLDVFPSLKK